MTRLMHQLHTQDERMTKNINVFRMNSRENWSGVFVMSQWYNNQYRYVSDLW